MPSGEAVGGQQPAPNLQPPSDASKWRQTMQLVVIPAMIVIVAIGVVTLFAMLASAKMDVDNLLRQLSQSSGGGKMAMGVQDPRYKDRFRAAYNLAAIIPTIQDAKERKRISDALIQIIDNHLAQDDEEIDRYLLLALGQLAQVEGLEVILVRIDSRWPAVRATVVHASATWLAQFSEQVEAAEAELTQAHQAGDDATNSDQQTDAPSPGALVKQAPARRQDLTDIVNQSRSRIVAMLTGALGDENSDVRTVAAAAIGKLAQPSDPEVIEALVEAMESLGADVREVHWNAAIALARLGQVRGSQFVAQVLLDREVLSKLQATPSGSRSDQLLSPAAQERIILRTLHAVRDVTDPVITDKINYLADKDPNLAVRSAAKHLVERRGELVESERR